jgi:hypothetical protein
VFVRSVLKDISFRISLNSLDSLDLHARKPADTIFSELFPLWLQFGLVQTQIIHRTDTQNRNRWKGRTDAIHERTTREAEIVGHAGVRSDGCRRIRPGFEVVAATHVLRRIKISIN